MDAFMNTINEGITATSLWTSIGPIAGFIVVLVLFAFARRILNKNLKSGKNGNGGKV